MTMATMARVLLAVIIAMGALVLALLLLTRSLKRAFCTHIHLASSGCHPEISP